MAIRAPRGSRAPVVPIGPGRTGHQTSSWRWLRIVAGATVVLIAALTGLGFLVPLVAFFAVGAGAGHSLSGSV